MMMNHEFIHWYSNEKDELAATTSGLGLDQKAEWPQNEVDAMQRMANMI